MFSPFKCMLTALLFLPLLLQEETTEAKTLLESLLDYPEPLNLDKEKSMRVAREWARDNKGTGKGTGTNKQKFFEYDDEYQDEYDDKGQQTILEDKDDIEQFTDQQQHNGHDPPTVIVPVVHATPPVPTTTECPNDLPTYRVYGILRCGLPIGDEPDKEEIQIEKDEQPEIVENDHLSQYFSQIGDKGAGDGGQWYGYESETENNQYQQNSETDLENGAYEQSNGIQSGTQGGHGSNIIVSSYEDTGNLGTSSEQGQIDVIELAPEQTEYDYETQQHHIRPGGPSGGLYEQSNDLQQQSGSSGSVVDQSSNPFGHGSQQRHSDFEPKNNAWPSGDLYGGKHVEPSFGSIEVPEYGDQPTAGDFDCFQRREGYYPDYSSGCKRFYRCAVGHFQAYEFICGPGTKFDETLNVCNHADQVVCGRRQHYVPGK